MTFMKTALFALVAAASLQAVAAPISHTISLEANVPTSDFYVLPKDSTWINQTQILAYSPYSGDLSSLTKQFDVKNTAGSITGKLLAPASLSSGSASIPLTVKFNSVTLSTTEAPVVTKAAAAAASTVNLEIIPVRQGGASHTPGNYSGIVQVSFDASI
jgi:hypothetical protein